MLLKHVAAWLTEKYYRVEEGKDSSSTTNVILPMNSFIKHALGVYLGELRPALVNYEPSNHVLDSDLDRIQAFMDMDESEQGLKLIEWSGADSAESKRRLGKRTLIFRYELTILLSHCTG